MDKLWKAEVEMARRRWNSKLKKLYSRMSSLSLSEFRKTSDELHTAFKYDINLAWSKYKKRVGHG